MVLIERWEYKIEKTDKDHVPDLNALGWEGWELVAVVPIAQGSFQDYKYFFKRKLRK